MSHVATFLSSMAPIKHDVISAYIIDTVGELDSSFDIYSLCGPPLAHSLALTAFKL
jgi:hypothetical protein